MKSLKRVKRTLNRSQTTMKRAVDLRIVPWKKSMLNVIYCTALALSAFAPIERLIAEEPPPVPTSESVIAPVRKAVVDDWLLQEKDAGREGFTRQGLALLAQRGRNTLAWAADEDWVSPERFKTLEDEVERAELAATSVPETAFDVPYLALRTAMRDLLLENPSVCQKPLVFLKSERFTWQILHEFMSYYYDRTNMNGGGLYVLKEPGRSFETEPLTDGKFPKGVFQTPSISWDGKTIYFAFADFTNVQGNALKPAPDALMATYEPNFDSDYMSKTDGKFHLYKLSLTNGLIEQLTDGPNDDFDPVELPNGDVIFMSTRRGGYGRCHGAWEPLRVHTLHRLNAKTGDVERLSWHETNEWQPTVLSDGRILYTRWDYVDRSASRHHGLWVSNPDGTAPSILFGNYTYDINACYQAKEVPNSKKILFLGGSHHLNVGGSLLMLDPSRVRYNPKTSEDDLSSVEMLSPEIDLPEVANGLKRGCNQYYHSPWPLSEDVYLTAFSHDPLGGYLVNTQSCGKTNLYYRDRVGNLELLYRDDSIFSSLYPMPIAEREKPRIVPSILPANSDDTGTFMLSNVYESVVPFPKDRKIKELRVYQLLPKGPDHRGHVPPIGHPFAGNARLLLGTVPVEEDGSAHFRAPARLPIYFQAVDESGRAVQTMRSLTYLQPGESRGCIGCHEQISTVQANAEGRSIASQRAPSEIEPGPEATRPFSYPLFVQPILDRNCVCCHDGKDGSNVPALTGAPEGEFSQSYVQLKPYLRWYEWLPDVTYRNISTLPGECGADICPLSKILNNKTHTQHPLSEEDRRALDLWMDFNVPFYGVYEADEQAKQRAGEAVPIPTLQ